MRIWRTTRLVNVKTETTLAGHIGDGDLMNYGNCVVSSSAIVELVRALQTGNVDNTSAGKR